MATLSLRRRVMFSAAHAYWFPERSEAENRALFGTWASRWGHGHNYVVELTVAGELDERTGMVVNITDVDKALRHAIAPLRDKHLTYEVPHFAQHPPTTENIALYLAAAFRSAFTDPAAHLTKLSVWETPTLAAHLNLEENTTMVALTRCLDFAASHRLHAPALTDTENLAVFGKCNNPAGHGHNYGVEVTVIGEPDPTTGMIVDLVALDRLLDREVMDAFDHKNLNTDTDDFKNTNPTSENLTLAIWRRLEGKIPAPAQLHKVVVRETERNYFEYEGK